MEVLNNGQRLQMDDGSIWNSSPGDIPTVCTWIPTATLNVRKSNTDRMFPYVLTNEGINVSVNAMKLK